jgi:Family of unknown function (DUF6439)
LIFPGKVATLKAIFRDSLPLSFDGAIEQPMKPSLFAHQPITNPLETKPCQELTDLELAQVLASRLALSNGDWHRQKGNRSIRAREQAAAALVALLRDQPQMALEHLQQAAGWLDRTVSAPPCPDHDR